MKRQKVFMFLLGLILVLTAQCVVIEASDAMTSHDGLGIYQFLETVESKQLHQNLYYQKDLGQTKTMLDKTPAGEDKNAAGQGGGGLLQKDVFYGQQINILMGKASKDMKVVSWGYTTSSKYQLRDVVSLARDYELNHPGWKVVAGINADFFDMQGNGNLPYQPIGPMISNGEVIRSIGSHNYSLMVGFKNKGQADDLVVKKYLHTKGSLDEYVTDFILSIYDENNEVINNFIVNKHNEPAPEGEISLYNANWSADKKIIAQEINSNGEVFVIEKAEKALANDVDDFYGRGVITSQEAKVLGEGEFAIVSNNDEVNKLLVIGTKVRVSRQFVGPYSEVEELAVGHGYLLHEGEESPLLNESYYYTRAPRSIVGIKEDGTIVLATIDGRQADKNMYGATQEEMVAIMKYYGCVGAYNLDGGGSTTMIIRKGNTFQVVNSPSDGSARRVANAIFFVVYDPDFTSIPLNVGRNHVEIAVDIKDNKGYEIEEIYVGIEYQLNKVENGKVLFTNLTRNTEYEYIIYYKEKGGDLKKTAVGGLITTAKKAGTIKSISYTEKNSDLIVEVEFDDPDGSITRAQVYVGDKSAYINSGQAIVRKVLTDGLNDIKVQVVYRVDLNNFEGYFEIRLNNPHLKLHNYIDFQASKHQNKINQLLR